MLEPVMSEYAYKKFEVHRHTLLWVPLCDYADTEMSSDFIGIFLI